ncbi:MAG: tRNA (adenine(22)-N(1))-methyltransferase TrmK [Betaproteobacteria bacterium]|nr:tRNA (adenine(22)-N(1))-methyltransferase TrmK [Betaproteobacteria bacterium]
MSPTPARVGRFDAAGAARLDRNYASPQIVEQRRRLRAAVAACSGEAGLDVGCGPGYLACELSREVAPGGRIVAIDVSDDMLAVAGARVAREKLDSLVDVRKGDAGSLDFPDATFDFVVGAQVYCFAEDIAHAIKEAARVLRKGGRLVILDTDWDLCVWKSKDRLATRRMIEQRRSDYAHPHLPRDLPGLFHAAGLTLARVDAYPIIETRYDPESYGGDLIGSVGKAALRQGVPANEVAAWEADLRSRTGEGEYFFCVNRFIFSATK